MKFPEPGTIVTVDFGIYKHLGIVTDRYQNGKPMVISNSFRRNGVYEEPWDIFACNNEVNVSRCLDGLDVNYVLARARSRIGTKWNLLTWNCEHFVSWAYGIKQRSPQLKSLVASIAIIAGVTLLTTYANSLKSVK